MLMMLIHLEPTCVASIREYKFVLFVNISHSCTIILKQIGKLGIHKTKDTIMYDLLKESKYVAQ